MSEKIIRLLGDEAEELLDFKAKVSKEGLHLPGPDFVDRVVSGTDRTPSTMWNMQLMFNTERLAGTGYLSVLPVDQDIEHSAGASFTPNPAYLDPGNIVKQGILNRL